MMKPDGGPAFPVMHTVCGPSGDVRSVMTGGMTLRDYFAAAALQGCLAQAAGSNVEKLEPGDIGIVAYLMADAMLAEREK